jgi:ABC-2 type transport system permease protein
MRNILTIAGRELKAYFVSPIAYVVFTVFFIISGWFFFNILSLYNLQSLQAVRYPALMERLNLHEMVLRPHSYNLSIILLLMIPVLTMRLWAEEKQSGTVELLLTSPLKLAEIVLGKYLSALTLLLVMMTLAFQYPLILIVFGNPEWGPIITTYLGLFLMGAAFLAVGFFASSLTENQTVAAIIGFGTLLFFWVISWASHTVGTTFGEVLSYLSLMEHFDQFSKGILDTKDIVFYLSFSFFGLFLTHRVIESHGWR